MKRFKAKATVDGKRRTVEVTLPKLVGVTRAAEILDLPKSNISRGQPTGMPEPILIEGGGKAWFEHEVVELAEKRAEARAAGEAV